MNKNKLDKSVLKEYLSLPEYICYNNIDLNTKSSFGDFPINIAASRGIITELSEFISCGANINAKGEHGYTPLHNAVEQGHYDIVEILLKSGADQTIKNDEGNTPKQLALLLGENEIYYFLQNLK